MTQSRHSWERRFVPSSGQPALRAPAAGLRRCRSIGAPVAALALAAVTSFARPVPVSISVYPTNASLETLRDRQSLIVQAAYPDETTRDVTFHCEYAVGDPGVARLEGNVLHPAGDGETWLAVAFEQLTTTIAVRVENAGTDVPVSFKNDVMPVMMRGGCNTGPCHGSARGQDGFRLSLFGYDPDGDYHRITREQSGRRINLADPTNSLMLTKAVNAVPHTGGKLFAPDSELYDTVLRWLRMDAPNDPTNIPSPVALEVMPPRIVMQGEGARQQLTARVRFSDGTDRDVTATAVFIGNNDNSAKVTKGGLITSGKRGEAFVMARYDVFNVGVPVIVVPDGPDFRFPEVPEFNYIDRHVHNKLRKLRVAPSEVCADHEFIRRVSLDVAGVLPSADEVGRFVADADPDKRAKLVDRLLGRKEFVEMWVMKWAELLQIRSAGNEVSYKNALLYYNWLQAKIAANVPINTIARELLSASGGTFKNPPSNYYQIEKDTLKLSENVAQVFAGIRLQCAQCHNHPFDRWTMNDYYAYAAFFAQVGRKNGDDPRETIVFDRGNGKMEHPVTKLDMAPQFLGGAVADVKDKDRREVFAAWLTAPDNPYFARNIANIVWASFLGRGIVEPVDDVRVSNPAVNPELLDALATKLVEYDFDLRRLVRDICTSRTYQLSTRTNPTNADDHTNFSHAMIRRVRAETLLDCISQVTETRNKFDGLPRGARAVQIADGNTTTYFLTTFGRATRETVCSCEVVMQPNLSQALHLLNGETTHKKIKEGALVKRLFDEKKAPADILNDLYLRCLARPPTDGEVKDLLSAVDTGEDKKSTMEDVFWALLNSKEFVFNH